MSDIGTIDDGFGEIDAELETGRALRLVKDAENRAAAAEIRKEPDIVARAKKLSSNNYINFKDVKKVRKDDMYILQPLMTDENKGVVLEALFGDDYDAPHKDTFRGRIVDHKGKIIDDHYPVMRWLEAFSAGGLKGVHAKAAREILKEWSLERPRNDLINRVTDRIPKWDEKHRMATKLIELFECRDTEINKEVGEYFWLSLYMRVMKPGCQAPIVLSLIGAQFCGKSYFGKRLCQIIQDDEDADTVQLNFKANLLDFLRSITGTSIVAAIGEMAGFDVADINEMKNFVTRDSDDMHYKFEGHFKQKRQWVAVMDSNRYDGIQKDATGNRRFFPLICGQIEDRDGQPAWRDDFAANFENFEQDVWQLMAEAADWVEKRGERADKEYDDLVRNVSNKVRLFNREERASNRGTSKDPILSTMFFEILADCNAQAHTSRKADVPSGVKIPYSEFHAKYLDLTKKEVNSGMLSLKVGQHGGEIRKLSKNITYLFWPEYTIDEFMAALDENSDGEGLVKKVPHEF